MEKSECIIWQGAKNDGGYPVTWENGKTVYRHRQLLGAKKGEVVLHSCDNPSCVNPYHLKKGSHKENSEDMVRKNRQTKGEECHLAKLNESIVKAIRSKKGELSSRATALLFGCSKTNVLDIWNNKIWRHLEST